MKESISIVTACYNEEKNIENILKDWINFLRVNKYISTFEIVITDDGSTDNTVQKIENLLKKHKQIKLFKFKKNLGASLAFINSIKKSKNKYILINDADDQFPIRNINKMFKKLKNENYDAVIGSRNRLKDLNILSIGSYLSSKILNVIFNSNVTDFNCALKLSKSKILKKLKYEAIGLNYSTDMTAKLIESKSQITNINIFHKKNNKKKTFIKNLKDSINRILFIFYLFIKRILKKLNIIM